MLGYVIENWMTKLLSIPIKTIPNYLFFTFVMS